MNPQDLRDAADDDPGEANEPALCPCGRGYIGHADHLAQNPPTSATADWDTWRDANMPGGE